MERRRLPLGNTSREKPSPGIASTRRAHQRAHSGHTIRTSGVSYTISQDCTQERRLHSGRLNALRKRCDRGQCSGGGEETESNDEQGDGLYSGLNFLPAFNYNLNHISSTSPGSDYASPPNIAINDHEFNFTDMIVEDPDQEQAPYYFTPPPSSGPSTQNTSDTRVSEYATSPSPRSDVIHAPSAQSESSPRLFPCDQCNRVFDQVHKLNHHRRYHERPRECTHPGCTMRFGTKTHLDRHINDKHNKTRKFHCTADDCPYSRHGGKSFPRKEKWRRHMMNKHRITSETEPEEFKELTDSEELTDYTDSEVSAPPDRFLAIGGGQFAKVASFSSPKYTVSQDCSNERKVKAHRLTALGSRDPRWSEAAKRWLI